MRGDRIDHLAHLDCETLVIVGDEDLRFVGPSERMASVIPNATLAVVPGAGHSPQFDHPDGWWEALYDVLGPAKS